MTTRILRPALAIAFLLSAVPALAQREGYSYLSWVGSEVTLVSSAEDDSTARPNTPILVGDRISTGAASRAEVILADGNVLRIDVGTDLRFDRLSRTYESEDDRNSIYLERGGIHLEHRAELRCFLVALVGFIADSGQRNILCHHRGRHRLRQLLTHAKWKSEHA